MLSRSVNHPNLVHLPASTEGTCRIWDLHLREENLREDWVHLVKFSEDGSLLAVKRTEGLELWKTSTWERLWSVRCDEGRIDFSHDGLRVLVKGYYSKKVHAYDVWSGDALGEVDSIPESMHDHVHWTEKEERNKWKCSWCESLLLKDGEYWFTGSDKWLWIVEARVAKRLVHIPEEYIHRGFKAHSGHVAGGQDRLLVLDTTRV